MFTDILGTAGYEDAVMDVLGVVEARLRFYRWNAARADKGSGQSSLEAETTS